MRDLNSSTHLSYRPDIDGLRAVAVLSVVLFHAFPNGLLRGGFVGVDIFFVISGYLISSILMTDLDKGRFSLTVFYRRRILRIFPALAVVLTFCLAIGWLALFPDEFRQIGKHVAAGATFIANLVLWGEVGYFDNAAELKPLLHLWSLGVEEQFYILWPIALLLIWRARFHFLPVALVLGAVSFAVSLYNTYADPAEAFFSPFARFWELLAGGWLAYEAVRGRTGLDGRANLKAIAGLVMIAIAVLAITTSSKFPGLWALLPVGGAFLLISAGPGTWINRKLLSNRAMVFVGLISYPLYLWHWPLLSFLRIGDADGFYREISVSSRLIAVLVAVVLSWAAWRFVERPIRFGRQKRLWSTMLASAMILIAAFGYVVYAEDGLPLRVRLDPPSSAVLFATYPHPTRNENCQRQYPDLTITWGFWACLLSKPEPATVAIIGNSHANQYYQSLASHLPNLSVLNVSQPGCLPFANNPACAQKSEQMIRFLADNRSIGTIIMTGYFSFLTSGFKYRNIEGQRVANELTAADKLAFQASAEHFLSALVALNRKLVVLIDIPDLIFRPKDCVAFENSVMAFLRGSVNHKRLDQCGIPAKEFAMRNRQHDLALLEVLARYPQVEVWDPRPLFCDSALCTAFRNDQFLYYNSDHLTVTGADLVISHLLDTSVDGQSLKGTPAAKDGSPHHGP